jgi:hypothetical protein
VDTECDALAIGVEGRGRDGRRGGLHRNRKQN